MEFGRKLIDREGNQVASKIELALLSDLPTDRGLNVFVYTLYFVI